MILFDIMNSYLNQQLNPKIVACFLIVSEPQSCNKMKLALFEWQFY